MFPTPNLGPELITHPWSPLLPQEPKAEAYVSTLTLQSHFEIKGGLPRAPLSAHHLTPKDSPISLTLSSGGNLCEIIEGGSTSFLLWPLRPRVGDMRDRTQIRVWGNRSKCGGLEGSCYSGFQQALFDSNSKKHYWALPWAVVGLNSGFPDPKDVSTWNLWIWTCLEKGSWRIKLRSLRWDGPGLTGRPHTSS